MTTETISPERVLELIEAYGAEPGAWPNEERAGAIALLARQPERFAAALSAARELDQLFLTEPVPEPRPELAAAILASAPAARPVRQGWIGALAANMFPQGARWPAGAALASLVMGVFGGYAYASSGIGYDQADAAYYAAFGLDTGEDWLVSE